MSNNGFDLANLETTAPSDRPAWMELRHPVSDEVITFDVPGDNPEAPVQKKPARIQLYGAESTLARNHRRELQRNRLTKLQRGRGGKVTPEQVEAETLDLFTKLTAGWEGISWKGQVLEFTPSNARMLYQELSWVRNQVDDFISDLSNYLGNS